MKTNITRIIKSGMWVVSVINGTRRVGIINDIGKDGPDTCRLNLVDADGYTTARLPNESLAGLEQARYDDIPEPRRSGLTREQFAKLGYL